MGRDVVEPTKNEHGEEQHPAFALIGANRVSTSRPGSTLFDSDIQHSYTVVVRIATATRKRDLSHDWLHRDREFVEVEMSEAQWASFVSSVNCAMGVSCTLRRREGDWNIPGLPYEPRFAESMSEVRIAGDRALEDIRTAFADAKEKPTKSNMKTLEARINNAVPNMEHVARSLSEHAENVVQRSRADIEAMVLTKAQQLGLNSAELREAPQLEAGEL
jgi:hypothetical protein